MLEPLHLKETLTQVCSCEYCEFFKNTYFEEHLRAAASEISALACVLFCFFFKSLGASKASLLSTPTIGLCF